MLEQERVSSLQVYDTHKDALKYVIQWMVAGGKDSTVSNAIQYPKDHLVNLVCLNRLTSQLGVGLLNDRTWKSIEHLLRYNPISLVDLQKIAPLPMIPGRMRCILREGLKKSVGTPHERLWYKQGTAQPELYQDALHVLSQVLDKIECEKEARRQALRAVQVTKQSTPSVNGHAKKPTMSMNGHPGARGEKVGSRSEWKYNEPKTPIGQTKRSAKPIFCFNCGQDE